MNNPTLRTVKVLLGVQAILISIIVGFVAGVFATAAGVVAVTAIASGGAAFLVAVPVVLGIQAAITD
jgi:hypothetical protein